MLYKDSEKALFYKLSIQNIHDAHLEYLPVSSPYSPRPLYGSSIIVIVQIYIKNRSGLFNIPWDFYFMLTLRRSKKSFIRDGSFC